MMVTLPLWVWLVFFAAFMSILVLVIRDYVRMQRERKELEARIEAFWAADRNRWKAISTNLLSTFTIPYDGEDEEEEDPADALWEEGEKPFV